MNKLKLQGRLFVEIDSNKEKDIVKFSIRPQKKYLSPDSNYAVCYNNEVCKSFKLENKKLILKHKIDKKYMHYLINIAMQQQNIEIFLDDECNMLGFAYPCEID